MTEVRLNQLSSAYGKVCNLVCDTKERLHLLSYQDKELSSVCLVLAKMNSQLASLSLLTPGASKILSTSLVSFEK